MSGPAQPPHRAGGGNGADLLPAGERNHHAAIDLKSEGALSERSSYPSQGLRRVDGRGQHDQHDEGQDKGFQVGGERLVHEVSLSLRRSRRRMKQSVKVFVYYMIS